MWQTIKSWFCSDYELIKSIPGVRKFGPNLSYDRPILYDVYYSKKKNSYKVYCIDLDGNKEIVENPSCFLHEARQKGHELP